MKRQKLPKYMWQEKNTFYVRMAVPKELRAFYSESNVTLEQLVDRFFENQRHQNRDPEAKRN